MNAGERRGIVIGTAGHVDHGKTSLVRALTGIETDRWEEERRRGLTIDIGFASLTLDAGIETGVVDVPGHEDFLRNMLAGATGIDLLLLVVAADEGPMPQTREHLAIARLLGLRRGVVALTKRDRVDPEWLELAREATRDLLREHPGFGEWPIFPVSSTTGEGTEDLLQGLAAAARELESRRGADVFRMPVDRVFTIRGTGTVVTGTVWSGTVDTGAQLRLLPGDRQVRVRGLQVHGEGRARASAGRRCAIALVGVDAEEAGRGSTLIADPAWRPASRLGVRLETLVGPGRPLEDGQRIRAYLGTREVMARVYPEGGTTVPPGGDAWAVLALESELVARAGDRVILRFYSPVTTIGGARVAELDPPRRWAERPAVWSRILDGPSRAAFDGLVGLRGMRGLGDRETPFALGLPPAAVDELAAASDAIRLGDRWFAPRAVGAAREAALEVVGRLHRTHRRAAAVSREAVRSTLVERCHPALADRALADLVEEGALVASGPSLALPGHEATLTSDERIVLETLRDAIRAGGLQPPTVDDLAATLEVPRDLLDDLLRLLVDAGDVRPITPEIQAWAPAVDEMVGRVEALLAGAEPQPPTTFKEAFGLTRKYLIPLLEYLDRSGVTRRTGEGRVLAGKG